MQLRSAVANGDLLVDHSGQRLISNLNELECVVGGLVRLGDDERDAFADVTNPVDGHRRPVRYHSTGDDPVGLDLAEFAGEIGTGESKAHAGGGPSCRKV